MKKQKQNSLALNKKFISNLSITSKIKGGKSSAACGGLNDAPPATLGCDETRYRTCAAETNLYCLTSICG